MFDYGIGYPIWEDPTLTEKHRQLKKAKATYQRLRAKRKRKNK